MVQICLVLKFMIVDMNVNERYMQNLNAIDDAVFKKSHNDKSFQQTLYEMTFNELLKTMKPTEKQKKGVFSLLRKFVVRAYEGKDK